MPSKPEQLETLPYLSFFPLGQRRISLPITNGRERKALRLTARLSCNNFFVLRSMAVAGSGFTAIPAFLAREGFAAGTLVPIVKDWTLETSPVQILVPRQRELPPKIRAFVEFLAERLSPVL